MMMQVNERKQPMRLEHFAVWILVIIPGCSIPLPEPAPSTPLPSGVFSGTDDCDLRITSPSGEQATQTNTNTVTFEINDRGVPIVLGEEIAVGRTEQFEGGRGTITRIAATVDGVVIHSTQSGSVNNVTYFGSAIATLSVTVNGDILYDHTQTWSDSAGFGYNAVCEFLLVP